MANEYPSLGGDFEVIHHSQLLDHLVTAGKLTPGGGYQGTVTYHDPCYLGRHNRVFDEPRSVIDAIPGATQVEMRRCREKGFCCGAGGARMWLEENIGKRVNMERTEEAIGTGADVVSTACPYCMIMLDDAVRANAKEDDVRVLDLSQLLEESMEEPARSVVGEGVGLREVARPSPPASCGQIEGTDSSSPLNWRCERTSRSMAVSDTTVADRGRDRSAPARRSGLPGPRVATFFPSRVTRAVPSTMTKHSIPIRPSSTRTFPAGTLT